MDLQEAIQERLQEVGIEGLVTHFLVTVCMIEDGDYEKVVSVSSDGVGMSMHLGMANASVLTANERFNSSEAISDEDGGNDE